MYCHYRHIKKVIINTIIIIIIIINIIVSLETRSGRCCCLSSYKALHIEQCGGKRGDYESYGRLAGMSEDNALG